MPDLINYVTKHGKHINPLHEQGRIIWQSKDGKVVAKEVITYRKTYEKTVFLLERTVGEKITV